ncbi:Fic family protein [Actinoplanes friuliensis]|uniref:Fic family protein n=1 Tax=Actinoplanes friuliensis TaxID=196914 RepID=UPI0004173546|nr:Fic family protein [Actinoplanes friuliensis]
MTDHLLGWLRIREHVPWSGLGVETGPVRGRADGVEDFVRDRRPELLPALTRVRTADVLTFETLASWLGLPATFRTGPAYAKRGREHYGLHPGIERRLAECLAEAVAPGVPVAARAARVYLDVAFFHPFPDANARAAMLALYFVLLRDGVVLDRAEPILLVTRRADDAEGAADLARLVDIMIAATRRRTHRHTLPA